ncbi:MAG: carbamoyltransferase HypF [Anaerolineae bacterium]
MTSEARERRDAARLHVTGVVQGVGFRPFVYGLASRLSAAGWVRNTSAGVDIYVEGAPGTPARFAKLVESEAPPLARIDSVVLTAAPAEGLARFEIRASEVNPDDFQPVSPDVATCPDCLAEMRDPTDRRHRYPFINCTNCGPRFTIITDVPYDRPMTTMAQFEMCEACAAEYGDPTDRRFHAQPVACPDCGPRVWLERGDGAVAIDAEAIAGARRLLADGAILAVKGLGGFHLACDAMNVAAVNELRHRKLRVGKPFAVMAPDMAAVEQHCAVDDASRELLESVARPVVILPRRAGSTIAASVAPDQDDLGVMLPYTPLHHLLLEREDGFPDALVMTSGNLSEEPIATENEEARKRLAGLADHMLLHDRDIRTRCDDSVVRAFEGGVYPLRRSRGYAPYPVRLAHESEPLIAVGAELKNTFCLVRGDKAFLSHHIGDLENYETLRAFEDGVRHFERLFRVEPVAVGYDLHPNYLATRYALERSAAEQLRAFGVQHHHAHVAACIAENGLPGDEPMIGVALDGTGYGDDGTIWGGEVLLADLGGYRRLFHLSYAPLPGGDAAVREPWRMALSWLRQAGVEWSTDLPPVRAAGPEALRVLSRQLELGLNAPPTSSMGRLFDAVSALTGLRTKVTYEAQAAIALEAAVDASDPGAYEVALGDHTIDPSPLIRQAARDVLDGVPVGGVAARFHRGVAQAVADACDEARRAHGTSDVALSGGVWQNVTLLRLAVGELRRRGFTVYLHRRVPANDGGLALGQAAVVAHALRGGRFDSI